MFRFVNVLRLKTSLSATKLITNISYKINKYGWSLEKKIAVRKGEKFEL